MVSKGFYISIFKFSYFITFKIFEILMPAQFQLFHPLPQLCACIQLSEKCTHSLVFLFFPHTEMNGVLEFLLSHALSESHLTQGDTSGLTQHIHEISYDPSLIFFLNFLKLVVNEMNGGLELKSSCSAMLHQSTLIQHTHPSIMSCTCPCRAIALAFSCRNVKLLFLFLHF